MNAIEVAARTRAAGVHGEAAPGFERVRECFAANFERTDDRREIGAAFTVYAGGRRVVDLWGGIADPQRPTPWTADMLVNVYSTTKGIAALCLAMLVDRGLVRYEDTMASIWPQFAQAGKSGVTVRQVLSHQAGLPAFDEPITTADLYDWDARCAALAAQRPRWTPGENTGYHPVTFGFLAGEIVRRVTGLTLGQFLTREIATPLAADFFVGLPGSLDARVARIVAPQNAIDPTLIPLPPETRGSVTNPIMDPQKANTVPWRRAELPALNGHASARGIARIYAVMANGGELEGRRLLSAGSLERMTAVQSRRPDLTLGIALEWAHGVALNGGTGFFGPNPRSYGHAGWGGSFGCADPDRRLGIGYVLNQMGPDLVGDVRARALCEAVYECLAPS
ncbi:MAG TPA: serine hydrolase domain-containing protein [Steroidobacteraceae bacterium]|nr:serine hydrolase domain-containing protein [Steroidobacteraceae bacterium]